MSQKNQRDKLILNNMKLVYYYARKLCTSTNDYDDYALPRGDYSKMNIVWTSATAPYLGYSLNAYRQFPGNVACPIFRCPSDDDPMFLANKEYVGSEGLSYAGNGFVMSNGDDGLTDWGVKLGKIGNASQVFYVLESSNSGARTYQSNNHDRAGYRHPTASGSVKVTAEVASGFQGGMNITYIDGHVGDFRGRTVTGAGANVGKQWYHTDYR